MAEQDRVPREVYVRRRLTVALAALVLAAGGVAAATQVGGDGAATDAGADITFVTVTTTDGSAATGVPSSQLAVPPASSPSTPNVTDATGTTSAPSGTSATSGTTDTVGSADAPPAVDAAAYAVYDTSNGAWLADDQGDSPRPVGSIMKLLTAKVVMETGDMAKIVTVPALQLDPMESAIGLYEGEQLPRDVLLRAMLIVSANDAARVVAIDVAGSEDAFADMMNATAQQIGMTNTVAVNPVGLDSNGAHSSARDMVKLADLLMRDDTFRATVVRPSANLHGQIFPATNDLLTTYPGADGIKTGHTTDAGYCLIGSATRSGRRIIVAVLGSSTEAGRVAAATTLLDWAFAQP